MDIKDYGFNEKMVNDTKGFLPARITAQHKGRYEIVCDMGRGFAVLKSGTYYNNPNAVYPTVGDFVLLEWNASGESLIVETIKRISSFSRADSGSDRVSEKHEQLVAANFDYVFIMQSLNDDFNLHRIERYLSLAWQSGAIPVIVLTKCDLVEDVQEYLTEVEGVAIGVDVYAISSKTEAGIKDLEKYFVAGKTIVFLGSSGVGKSTLVNLLMGEEVMKTNEIRDDDSKGRHTTTSRQLLMLPNGTMIIDTPGMRELGMWDVSVGLNKTFQDVEQYLGYCKYSDCTHTNEDGCKILEAIENGELSEERYQSYIKLKDEARYNMDKDMYLREKKDKFKKIAKEIRNMEKKR